MIAPVAVSHRSSGGPLCCARIPYLHGSAGRRGPARRAARPGHGPRPAPQGVGSDPPWLVLPAEGLALVAKSEAGTIIGSVRLWNVATGETGLPALLLGPLAVMPELAGCGIGSALMRRAVAEAHWRGHAAILLVGDPDYYARFGFSAVPAAGLAMPGPFERHRMLGLEITPGALAGAQGLIRPTGRRTASTGSQKTAVAPQARPARHG